MRGIVCHAIEATNPDDMILSRYALLTAFLLGGPVVALDEPSLTAGRVEVTAGQSVELKWLWKPATAGYLSAVGTLEIPSQGMVSVTPTETTAYVLILEAPLRGTRVLSATITVQGAKGESGLLPDDPFSPLAFQSDYDLSKRSLAVAAAKTRTVLQDEQGFQTTQYSPGEGQIVFVTRFLEKSSLSEGSDEKGRLRRIAYRVSLSSGKATGTLHANLSATIQWRIVVDRQRWFPENSSSSGIYLRALAQLKNAIFGK